MINIKFNNRTFAFLTSGVFAFSLYGCSNSKDANKSSNNFISSDSGVTDVLTFESTVNSGSCDNIITTAVNFEHSYNFENDDIVLDYYDMVLSDINSERDNESFLDKGKRYFIYSVDFLFYDSEINGVKFSDLTSSAKEQLLHDIVTIDDLISSKFPNYKEDISNTTCAAFNKVMEIVRAGCKNINDFSCDKLGEENYKRISDFKKSFVETAFGDWNKFIGVVDTGKQKVKGLYENFRNNNQSTTEGHK